jgi:hypothetical protein
MIHHIVMMTFKPETTDEQVDALERALDDLPNRISDIHVYEFGRDIVRSDRSYDFALVSLFATLEALRRYQEHPEHLKVLKTIKELTDTVAAVDFESQPYPKKDPQTFEDLMKLQGRL